MRNPFRTLFANDYLWRDDFVDVRSLNASASELIASHIEQVREACAGGGDLGELCSSCILLVGPAGAGKTHLFARLRRALGRRAVFVLIRPDVTAQASLRQALANTVDALGRRPGTSDRRQLDVVVGALLAAAKGENVGLPLSFLNSLAHEPAETLGALREDAIELVERRGGDIHPVYLERLVQLPFAERPAQRALCAWLSGREPSEAELARIGARGALDDTEILPALRTLGVAAGIGAPLVLVFDQLENLLEDDEVAGRIRAYARMVGELRDAVPGLVIVQMALDHEWEGRIRPALNPAERDRLEQHRLTLALPTAAERRELVELWLDRLPRDERLAPCPWPFSAEQIEQWSSAPGLTPRMLLQGCAEAFEHGAGREPEGAARGAPGGAVVAEDAPGPPSADEARDDAEIALRERLQQLWDEQRERARAAIDESAAEGRGVDGERILQALVRALRLTELGRVVRGKAPNARAPSVRLDLGAARIEVVVIQQRHPLALSAALKRVAERETATLLLREEALAFAPTWKRTVAQLDALRASGRARLVMIEREPLGRLLALYGLLSAARSQDLSDDAGVPIGYETVLGWARAELGVESWPLLLAIRRAASDPEAGLTQRPAEPPPERGPAGAVGPTAVAEPAPAIEPGAAVGSGTTIAPAAAAAIALLEALRVASIGNLVRQVRARHDAASTAEIVAALRRHGCTWIGDGVVAAAKEAAR